MSDANKDDGAAPRSPCTSAAEDLAREGLRMRKEDGHSFHYACAICSDRHGIAAGLLKDIDAMRSARGRGHDTTDPEAEARSLKRVLLDAAQAHDCAGRGECWCDEAWPLLGKIVGACLDLMAPNCTCDQAAPCPAENWAGEMTWILARMRRREMPTGDGPSRTHNKGTAAQRPPDPAAPDLRWLLRELRYWLAAEVVPARRPREAIIARIDAALDEKQVGAEP